MKTRKASKVIKNILNKIDQDIEEKAKKAYPDELGKYYFEDTLNLFREAYIKGYKEGFRVGGKQMSDWIEENNKDTEDILSLISDYGQIWGDHHKAWVLDQIVRIITKDKYDAFVKSYCDGDDGPDTYDWDTGIAP